MKFGAAKIDEARKVVYVQEILDATRFVGVWRGQTYECRAAPSTVDMTAGEQVVCHVLPGNSELVAVRPVGGEVLFVSSGGADEYTPEVWMFTSPTAAPTKIFEQATTGVYRLVTAMAWCQATNSLIFVCSGTNGDPHLVYEYYIGDASATLRHTYDPNADYGVWAGCIDMAECGGRLYFWHSGVVDESILYRCDPTDVAATFEMVFNVSAAYHLGRTGEGGIAIVGGVLYVISNSRIYASASGDLGTWAQVYDLWTLNIEGSACALVTDPINDCAYFATLRRPAYLEIYRCIRRLNADGSLTLEHQEAIDWRGYPFTAIARPYAPSTDTQPAALQRYAYAKGDPKYRQHDVYRRQADGSWAYEDSGWLDPDYVEPCAAGYDDICGSVFTIIGANQGSVYWLGKLYAIIEANWLEVDLVTWHYRCLLMRQTAVGNWEMIHEFDDHTLWASSNYHFLSCLTVGRTTKLIQNL